MEGPWARKEGAAMAEEKIHVPSIACDGCVRAVTGAVRKLDGVEEADAGVESKDLVVRYDADRLSRAEIEQAVEDAGHEVGR